MTGKINFFSVFLIMMILTAMIQGLPAQKKKSPTTFDLQQPYALKEEGLLVSRTDLDCCYFIRPGMGVSEEIEVIGTERMDWDKKDFSDDDKLFIDKGFDDGLNEGDILQVVGKHHKVYNRINDKYLGRYYLKKSLAKITCIYGDRAVITLQKSCQPVNIGDYLLPYKAGETLMRKKVSYRRCRLPGDAIEGNVVYISMHEESERMIAGPGEYVTVDLGKAVLSRWDFLLFFKKFRKDLPPLISGIGVVLETDSTNATVKILDAFEPVTVGVRFALLTEEDFLPYDESDRSKMRRLTGEDSVPTLDGPGASGEGGVAGTDTLTLDILFNLNQTGLDAEDETQLARVGEFIADLPGYDIVLKGYSCSIGGVEYNLKVSSQRVDSVKKYLVDTVKVNEKSIESYFYGEKDAPHDNTTEEERRKNRLVKVQVIAKKKTNNSDK